MKIKNVSLFRRRANSHAAAGHVAQGTYGSGKVNGHVEFKGCFVSCLATPHTKRALRTFVADALAKIKNPRKEPARAPAPGTFFLNIYGARHKNRITEEFGLNAKLLTAIEGFFEAQRTHGAAINFVPAVAAALNEGADIKPRQVERFIQEELGLKGRGQWVHGEKPGTVIGMVTGRRFRSS